MRQPALARSLTLASLVLATAPTLAADVAAEQTVGAIEAVIFVCAPIDAKSARTGAELLENTTSQRKLDLPAIRKSAAYKAMYNSEANRLLSLAAKDRLAACKNAW